MSGLGSPSADEGITPGRRTTFHLNTPVWDIARSSWYHSWDAGEMGRNHVKGQPQSGGVEILPGFAWALRRLSYGIDLAGQNGFLQGAQNSVTDLALTLAGCNVVDQVTTYFSYRQSDDLRGIDTNPDFLNRGLPYLCREVPAGASWEAELVHDAQAFPKPVSGTSVAMDRILASRATYHAGLGFLFGFYVPPGPVVLDYLYTFYFGGPTDCVARNGQPYQAGEWAVVFRGDGMADLWAREAQEWHHRLEFQYSTRPRSTAGLHTISIQPFGRSRIIIQSFQAQGEAGSSGAFQYTRPGRRAEPVNVTVYKHSANLTGYTFNQTITGSGPVRVDARRDLRWLFAISREAYRKQGTLVDSPFSLPYVVAAGTPLYLRLKALLPPGTTLTARLYDATTHQELFQLSGGDSLARSFATNDLQKEYYVKVSFTGDGEGTPLLYGCEVEMNARIILSNLQEVTGGIITRFSATGADLQDIGQETGDLHLYDPTGELSVLNRRARIPCQLRVHLPTGQPGEYSVVFGGEVAKAKGALMPRAETEGALGGGAPTQWPAADWKEWNVLLVGQWARLYDKVVLTREPFEEDQGSTPDPKTGSFAGWKIRDIISYLFNKAGVPNDELDLPENPLRLWGDDDKTRNDYVLQPNSHYAEAIRHFAQDYLGWYFYRDWNAGPRGMWRAFVPPDPATDPIKYIFVDGPEPGQPGLVHHPGTYGEGKTWIRSRSYEEWTAAPEANYIMVMGLGESTPNPNDQLIIWNELRNFKSYSPNPENPTADPDSVDYVGYELPLYYPDPALRTQAAVNFVTRRLYDAVAHGRRYAAWQSPMVFITDPLDPHQVRPRPLRMGDLVVVRNRTTMIKSVDPVTDREEGGDNFQWAYYEAVSLNPDAES